eukprot:g31483.t1
MISANYGCNIPRSPERSRNRFGGSTVQFPPLFSLFITVAEILEFSANKELQETVDGKMDIDDGEIDELPVDMDEEDHSKTTKAMEHETRIKTAHLFLIVGFTVVVVVVFTLAAFLVGLNNDSRGVDTAPRARNPTLLEAHTYSNCSDFEGAVKSVQNIAHGEGYLHQFEYDRYHPCCRTAYKRDPQSVVPLTAEDIVFIIMTTDSTEQNARAIKKSWGKGMSNLLFVSDQASTSTTRDNAIHVDDIEGPMVHMDKQHLQIWAMRYISTREEYAHLRDKKWFFLADDETWVNVPALLDLASAYDPRCPVAFGYVWSKVWIEDFDYISGGAGLLLSASAYSMLTPSFFTDKCPFSHYDDVTFAKCAWALRVQIVHHRGFYFDPPERSKDRHETVWFPPIAEAITYHHVHPEEMPIMTDYANERWQYSPEAASSKQAAGSASSQDDIGLAPSTENAATTGSSGKKEKLEHISYLFVDSDWVARLQQQTTSHP